MLSILKKPPQHYNNKALCNIALEIWRVITSISAQLWNPVAIRFIACIKQGRSLFAMGKITEIDQRRTIAGSNALAPVTCNLIPNLESTLSTFSPLPLHALYPGTKATNDTRRKR